MKRKLLFITGLLVLSGTAGAQQNTWSRASQKNVKETRERSIRTSDYQLVNLNTDELKHQLSLAPDRNRLSSEKGILVKFPNDQEHLIHMKYLKPLPCTRTCSQDMLIYNLT